MEHVYLEKGREDPVEQYYLPDNTQGVINQESRFRRTPNTGDMGVINRVDQGECLFKRECLSDEVVLSIIFGYTLRQILDFRLVSRGFCGLISKETNLHTSYMCSLLMNKAAVSFGCRQLWEMPNQSLKSKFDFCDREKVDMDIVINVSSFITSGEALNCIEENRLKIILKFLKLDEVEKLRTLLSNHPYPKFVNKVKGLDLENLKVNNDSIASIDALLTTIDQNIAFLPNLTNLKFGDIEDDAIFKKMIFNLPDTQAFNQIRRLSIGNIDSKAVCNIPNAFINLENLSVGDIGNIFSFSREALKLPGSLPYLINLVIGKVDQSIILNLPSLDKLENFSIGEVKGKVNMPDLMPNLIDLNIFTIEASFSWTKVVSFINLKNLHINTLGVKPAERHIVYQFNSLVESFDRKEKFTNLENLHIGEVHLFDFSQVAFPNLKSLYIKTVHEFDSSQGDLTNLTNLWIDQIVADGGKLLLGDLPNLTSLSIKMANAVYMYPDQYHSLGRILRPEIILPNSLNKLTRLDINGHNGILWLPTIKDGLKIFIIQTRHDSVTRELLNEINIKLNVETEPEEVKDKDKLTEVCSIQ